MPTTKKITPSTRRRNPQVVRLQVVRPIAKAGIHVGDLVDADMETATLTITRTLRLHPGALRWLIDSNQLIRRPTIGCVA